MSHDSSKKIETATSSSVNSTEEGPSVNAPGGAAAIERVDPAPIVASSGVDNPFGADFTEVVFDRPSVKFEPWLQRNPNMPGVEVYAADGPRVCGLLLAALKFGERVDEETGEMKPYVAYVIQSEIETRGFDAEGTPVQIQKGQQHLLWPSARLNQAIAASTGIDPLDAANHPEFLLRIGIIPVDRRPQKKRPDRKLWNFRIFVGRKAVSRRAASSQVAGLLKAPSPPAL